MSKGGWQGLQIVGMVIVAVFAQASIRSLFDHSATQLWGAFDWVPGEWGGRLLVFLLLAAAGLVLAGWAHDRGKQAAS
ncbi:hypothetical protein [Amycolatopsis alba]|uniref:Uncharacterized protein n=1 Tax=Amycolatopsis alba DSM 44262 TaxID=1125972 RepID=A0A229RGM0_AMYAL|nr:hypothetical protein [Amycolatopsis alba]OXM45812.1 hypothetical protein CFP75_29835 [Amycolatopsis alba DSM 44262]